MPLSFPSSLIKYSTQLLLLLIITGTITATQVKFQSTTTSFFQTPRYIMGQAMSTTQFFLYGKRHFTAYVRFASSCVFNILWVRFGVVCLIHVCLSIKSIFQLKRKKSIQPGIGPTRQKIPTSGPRFPDHSRGTRGSRYH